jgi:hydrogenase maturation factor
MVQVEIGGRRRQVSIALLEGPPPAIGERLVIHAGLAVGRIDESTALEIERMLEGFGEDLSQFGDSVDGGTRGPLDESVEEEVAS